jgi:arsenate reductase (thioredoxin)
MFSDTFAGIAPSSVPAFLAAQLLATGVAVVVIRTIYPAIGDVADRVILPHDPSRSGG